MITFREALIKKLDETGISLRQVAVGSGVSYEQLKKLKQVQSRTTNVDDAMKVARFFGTTLDRLISGDDEGSNQEEIILILERLSPAAREVLTNAARAQLAAETHALQPPDEDDQ